MSKRNPYRVAESVFSTIGNILLILLFTASLGLAGYALVREFEWWGLLAFPLIPVLIALVALIWHIVDWVGHKWRQAKWRWEDNRRNNETEETK